MFGFLHPIWLAACSHCRCYILYFMLLLPFLLFQLNRHDFLHFRFVTCQSKSKNIKKHAHIFHSYTHNHSEQKFLWILLFEVDIDIAHRKKEFNWIFEPFDSMHSTFMSLNHLLFHTLINNVTPFYFFFSYRVHVFIYRTFDKSQQNRFNFRSFTHNVFAIRICKIALRESVNESNLCEWI